MAGTSSAKMRFALLPGHDNSLASPKRRCGAGLSGLERAQFMTGRRSTMTRFLFIIPLILMTSAAPAQQDACARDASRFCRAHLNDGDQVVLACLKQNRARLSKGCQQLLANNGQ
jgi:hypothetical protein